jgi:hypothetical protein
MKRIFFFLIISTAVLLQAQTADELIAKGDSLTEAFNGKGALEVYLQAEKLDADNWELQWRLSRSYSNIAAHIPKESSEQEDEQYSTYETAMVHAEKAVKLAPDKTVPYLRRAIVNGRIALFKGVFSVSDIVAAVRDDCLKALKLNNGSDYDMALTHYILARTHAKISRKWKPALSILGMGWAELDTALVHYKKAVSLYDNYIMFYFDYAKALIRDDKEDEARAILTKLPSLKIKEQDDPNRLKEAKEILEDL